MGDAGSTGCGKSLLGNLLLGRNAFHSQRSAAMVTLRCQRATLEAGSSALHVIDTPGDYLMGRLEAGSSLHVTEHLR